MTYRVLRKGWDGHWERVWESSNLDSASILADSIAKYSAPAARLQVRLFGRWFTLRTKRGTQ